MLHPRSSWPAIVDAVHGDPDPAKQRALMKFTAARSGSSVPGTRIRDDRNDSKEVSAFLSSASEDFDAPVPLPDDRRAEAPAFPIDVLPPVPREMVATVAASTQTPPDLPGCILLAVGSATVAGKTCVDAESHREHLNLWIAAILPAGERKSSALEPIVDPIYRVQAERLAEAKAGSTERELQLELAKGEFDRLKKDKDASPEQLAAALEARKRAEQALVAPAQLIVSDVTAEALANDLAANPHLLIASAEGGLLDNFLGRYARGVPNLDLLNKSWAGESHTVRRVSHPEGGVFVDCPTLTIAIAPQPFVIRELARNQVMTARGTLSRFLLAAPRSLVGSRPSTAPRLDRRAVAAYDALIRELMQVDESTENLQILPPAHEVIRRYRDGLERRAGAAADERFLAFLARMHGQVYRLAGVLHFLHHGAAGIHKPIERASAEGAVRLATYYETHAGIALDLIGEDDVMRRARILANWLGQRVDAAGSLPLTTFRDAHRAHNKWNRAELRAALDILEERDLYHRKEYRSGSPGRPAVYLVRNPKLARANVGNAVIELDTAGHAAPRGNGCVAPGCDQPGDVAHDNDLYCARHAISFGLEFDPLVIETTARCLRCGRETAAPDSDGAICPTCARGEEPAT